MRNRKRRQSKRPAAGGGRQEAQRATLPWVRITGTVVTTALLAITLLATDWIGNSRQDEIPGHGKAQPAKPAIASVPPNTSPTQDPIKAFLASCVRPNPGFVGVETCRACHPQRVAEFTQTAHYAASRLANGDNVTGDYGGQESTYLTRDPNLTFELSAQDERFFQTSIRRTDQGEQRIQKPVDLVFGAGEFDEIYHYWEGKQLYQLPIAWIRSEAHWVNAPGFFDATANFQRQTGPRCLECHSTWFQHTAGSLNAYSKHNFVLGITCERCHGPGEQHVEYHQSHSEATDAQFVVKPGELARERQIEICAQCHSETNRRHTPPFTYIHARRGTFRLFYNGRPEARRTRAHVESDTVHA